MTVFASFSTPIVWSNVLKIGIFHLLTFYSIFLLVPFAHNGTIFFGYWLSFLTMFGVQIGVHRMWSHRSFKANAPLRLFFGICQTMALQTSIYNWVRDHRAHHYWSETDADPHDSRRGFFFSHCGWLMVRKHPEVLRKGATIDLSDIKADPIVMFQHRHYLPLALLFWGILPTLVPVYFWNETTLNAFTICVLYRYLFTSHMTWLVNSWAHHAQLGTKPYNQKLAPVECSIRHFLNGEGYHNYHHVFPWDYSASELGPADVFNMPTAFIELFYCLGWAWDLKKPTTEQIERVVQTKGDNKLRYTKGRTAWEWFWGLLVIMCPSILLLTYKYLFLYCYQI